MHSCTSWDCVLILKILKQKNNISDFQSSNLLLEFKTEKKLKGRISLCIRYRLIMIIGMAILIYFLHTPFLA